MTIAGQSSGPVGWPEMKVKGIVYIVGAGPGDAGLLTVRGAELIGRSDVVVHDADRKSVV